MHILLDFCMICSRPLLPNPLYKETVSKYCPRDGDFFVQSFRGQEPQLIFREFPEDPLSLTESARTAMTVNPGYVIRCNQTGVVYSSARRAAEELGLPRYNLALHLIGNQPHVRGYTFTKMGENTGYARQLGVVGDVTTAVAQMWFDKPYQEPRQHVPTGRRTGRPGQPLQCNETGVVFPSAARVIAEMGLSFHTLSRHLKGKTATAKGFTFTKLGKDWDKAVDTSQKIHGFK